ncbi:hypothetical protein T261_4094 [Streptomyces lydicus]|nr:hypothetical protein T261_4094 [Streptomyces lydicus]
MAHDGLTLGPGPGRTLRLGCCLSFRLALRLALRLVLGGSEEGAGGGLGVRCRRGHGAAGCSRGAHRLVHGLGLPARPGLLGRARLLVGARLLPRASFLARLGLLERLRLLARLGLRKRMRPPELLGILMRLRLRPRLRYALTLGGRTYGSDRADRPAGYPFPAVLFPDLLLLATGTALTARITLITLAALIASAALTSVLVPLLVGRLFRRRSEPTPIATAAARRAAIGRCGGRSVHGLPRLERLSVVFALPLIGTARNSPRPAPEFLIHSSYSGNIPQSGQLSLPRSNQLGCRLSSMPSRLGTSDK